MTNDNYRRGVEAERRLKSHLESFGCYVMRSAGSRGVADLLVLEPTIASTASVRMLQLKVGAFDLHRVIPVLRELALLEDKYSVKCALWHYKGDGKWRIYEVDQELKHHGAVVWWTIEEYDDDGRLSEPKQPVRRRPKVATVLRKASANSIRG